MIEERVPDDLYEKAYDVYEYDVRDETYVRPHTEEGFPDLELMLDLMGLTVGAIYVTKSEKLGDTKRIVTERFDTTINHIEEYEVERGGMRSIGMHYRDGDQSWDSMQDSVISQKMDDKGASPVKKWQSFLKGRTEIIAHLDDIPVPDDAPHAPGSQ